jgi:DNA sulfur modification protein DndC
MAITKHKQLDIFKHTEAGKAMRLSLQQAIALTEQSLQAYGSDRSTWVVGYSGGKDSSATITLIDWLIREGRVRRPENLVVVYADTLMELPPLELAARSLLAKLSEHGWRIIKSEPALETAPTKTERFFVTMLGRGYPPPSNRFRWCTDRMKADKIDAAYKVVCDEYGEDFLGIDGIRKGESAARDQIIVASCSTNDGECGQGWFHKNDRGSGYKLSPLLHWRVCHVWDWLFEADILHGYPVAAVAETYGMDVSDGDEPIAARTGCIGCPLVTTSNEKKPKPDKALATVVASDKWNHLAPYQRLSEIYWALRWNRDFRHIKINGQKGCLTLESRLWALEEILAIQRESIALALDKGLEPYLLIKDDEEQLIRKMISDRTFPDPRKYSPEEFAEL